jgi:hypothetical protein
MTTTSSTPDHFIEQYLSIKLSDSQYEVLQTISQVKAMTIEGQWALRKSLRMI